MSEKLVTPLLKWPGGKKRVLPEINKYVPNLYNTYYEPFLGGAAVFLNIKPQKAVISDTNWELINLYTIVKANPTELIEELSKPFYENSKEQYQKVRNLDREETYNSLTNIQKAARTLYLNKTCFNGLYRVNSKNQYNTPYGYYTNPTIVNKPLITEIHKIFNNENITMLHNDYLTTLNTVTGDSNFVYLDPPYIPLTATSAFTAYTKDKFNESNQRELADTAQELNNNGNYVLLSNSDTELTREIFKDFILAPIQVQRSVSANKTSRVKAKELLIIGKHLHQHLNK